MPRCRSTWIDVDGTPVHVQVTEDVKPETVKALKEMARAAIAYYSDARYQQIGEQFEMRCRRRLMLSGFSEDEIELFVLEVERTSFRQPLSCFDLLDFMCDWVAFAGANYEQAQAKLESL